MRILIDNVLLADSNPAAGCVGPSGLSVNGERIVDEVTFWQAAARVYFDRGVPRVQVQFGVQWIFASIRLAEKFALTHANDVPGQGVLSCIAGITGDLETLYLSGAVVAVQVNRQVGTSVFVTYEIKGGKFQTDVPDGLPDEPDPADDFIVRRRGSIQLTAADVGKVVTFSTPLGTAPTVVWAWITRPSGGQDIRAIPDRTTYATTGFSCDFTGAIPDGTYYLEYIAIE